MLGGSAFTYRYTIVHNEFVIPAKALLNIRAEGLIFISKVFAIQLSNRFSLPLFQTPDTYQVRGFNRAASQEIEDIIFFGLEIDKRRVLDIPIVVVKIKLHDLIIRRKWFEQYNVLLDYRRRRLI